MVISCEEPEMAEQVIELEGEVGDWKRQTWTVCCGVPANSSNAITSDSDYIFVIIYIYIYDGCRSRVFT